jgi:hypothetical protein
MTRDVALSDRNSDVSHGIYFLFIGGSSTQLAQYPLGFLLDAFLTTLIFIVISRHAALATVCASERSAESKLRL